MLQWKWGMHLPKGRWHAPWVDEKVERGRLARRPEMPVQRSVDGEYLAPGC